MRKFRSGTAYNIVPQPCCTVQSGTHSCMSTTSSSSCSQIVQLAVCEVGARAHASPSQHHRTLSTQLHPLYFHARNTYQGMAGTPLPKHTCHMDLIVHTTCRPSVSRHGLHTSTLAPAVLIISTSFQPVLKLQCVHGVPMEVVAPTPQYDPLVAEQRPEHDDVVRPVAPPYRPAGHIVQLPREPVEPYCPMGHGTPVADVAPAVHTRPAVALHESEQAVEVKPVVLPNRPRGHSRHVPWLSGLYWPIGHGSPDDAAAPMPQNVPGVATHTPAHAGDVAPSIQSTFWQNKDVLVAQDTAPSRRCASRLGQSKQGTTQTRT